MSYNEFVFKIILHQWPDLQSKCLLLVLWFLKATLIFRLKLLSFFWFLTFGFQSLSLRKYETFPKRFWCWLQPNQLGQFAVQMIFVFTQSNLKQLKHLSWGLLSKYSSIFYATLYLPSQIIYPFLNHWSRSWVADISGKILGSHQSFW